MNEEDVVKLASKTAIEAFEKRRTNYNKHMKDSLAENTKMLLKNYVKLESHVQNLVKESVNNRPSELQVMLTELFDRKGLIRLQAIIESRERTERMLEHVDTMLSAYRLQCEKKNKDYFEVVWRFYINNDQMVNIAESLGISESTAWRYLQNGVEDLSVLLWGLRGITVNW